MFRNFKIHAAGNPQAVVATGMMFLDPSAPPSTAKIQTQDAQDGARWNGTLAEFVQLGPKVAAQAKQPLAVVWEDEQPAPEGCPAVFNPQGAAAAAGTAPAQGTPRPPPPPTTRKIELFGREEILALVQKEVPSNGVLGAVLFFPEGDKWVEAFWVNGGAIFRDSAATVEQVRAWHAEKKAEAAAVAKGAPAPA